MTGSWAGPLLRRTVNLLAGWRYGQDSSRSSPTCERPARQDQTTHEERGTDQHDITDEFGCSFSDGPGVFAGSVVGHGVPIAPRAFLLFWVVAMRFAAPTQISRRLGRVVAQIMLRHIGETHHHGPGHRKEKAENSRCRPHAQPLQKNSQHPPPDCVGGGRCMSPFEICPDSNTSQNTAARMCCISTCSNFPP